MLENILAILYIIISLVNMIGFLITSLKEKQRIKDKEMNEWLNGTIYDDLY